MIEKFAPEAIFISAGFDAVPSSRNDVGSQTRHACVHMGGLCAQSLGRPALGMFAIEIATQTCDESVPPQTVQTHAFAYSSGGSFFAQHKHSKLANKWRL